MNDMLIRPIEAKIEDEEMLNIKETQNRNIMIPQHNLDFNSINHITNLKDFLKQNYVKKDIEQNLKKMNFQNLHLISHPLEENVHIKNYCKMFKHLLNIEYHQFDHNWYMNMNRYSNTELVDYDSLAMVPGRLEYVLRNYEPDGTLKKIEHTHIKLPIENNF